MPAVTRPKQPPRNQSRRPSAAERKACGRDRVSNGRDLLPNIDGRTILARRYRTIANAIVLDLGGADTCSEAKRQLARRFAAASALAEQLESKLVNGEQIDISEHALLCSTLVRVARQIGVNRVARDITPSLSEYLARRQLDAAE
jgi:hypothetical protein